MRKTFLILPFIFIVFFVSCASKPQVKKGEAYAQLYMEEPLAVLVMPPINKSVNVDAKDFFYSTLNVPIANAGYYTYPLFLTLETLQRESAYDSELFIEGDLKKFNQLFGADLVLFTVIENWEKHHIAGKVIVGIDYIVRSAKTNEIVYRRRGSFVVDTTVNTMTNALSAVPGGVLIGLVIDKAATAIKTAATDPVWVSRQCNNMTIANDIPKGKYHPKFGLDKEEIAYGDNLSIVVEEEK